MKVSVVSFGKFHSFNLAAELKKNNCVIRLYSSYPFYIAKKYGINYEEYRSFFLLQIFDRISKRKLSYFLKIIFAKIINVIIDKNSDFIIVWSDMPSFLIKSLKNKYNSKVILERGSSHILHQNKILQKEYSKFNINYKISSIDIKDEILNYENSDYISIPSNFVKTTFINRKIYNLFVNPYGSDLSNFYPLTLKKSNFFFNILTVGGSSVRKGLIYALKSHKKIKHPFRHYHVGNIDRELVKELKFYPNLIHIHSVKQEKLREFYQNSNLFILPTLEEGLSLTILEAMGCGIPIIATKNSGIKSIKSRLNFYEIIETCSPESIANKINYFIENPDKLESMSKNSLKVISKGGYTWKDYGLRYYNFLNEKKNINL